MTRGQWQDNQRVDCLVIGGGAYAIGGYIEQQTTSDWGSLMSGYFVMATLMPSAGNFE
jgi:hypothetical protein